MSLPCVCVAMRFRPCIDLRNGSVTQIVGSTLTAAQRSSPPPLATENFVSAPIRPLTTRRCTVAAGLPGGHVIMLGAGQRGGSSGGAGSVAGRAAGWRRHRRQQRNAVAGCGRECGHRHIVAVRWRVAGRDSSAAAVAAGGASSGWWWICRAGGGRTIPPVPTTSSLTAGRPSRRWLVTAATLCELGAALQPSFSSTVWTWRAGGRVWRSPCIRVIRRGHWTLPVARRCMLCMRAVCATWRMCGWWTS